MQSDESTDKSGLAQLIVFVKYTANGKLEELFMCVVLFGTCAGEDIFSAVDTRLCNYGLSWEFCISICTDGAEAMVGKHKRFLARVSQIAPHINFTHCIIHGENLDSKTLDQKLKCALNSAVKIANQKFCTNCYIFKTKNHEIMKQSIFQHNLPASQCTFSNALQPSLFLVQTSLLTWS